MDSADPRALADFQALLTPAGQELLHAAEALNPREETYLRDLAALQRAAHASPRLARAALEIAILRREAGRKFADAGRLYFTRPALEQASPQEVSQYRSQRYRGFAHLLDLGCSVGSDTLALARLAPAAGVDLDPLRLLMARANCAAQPASFLRADLTAPLPFAASDLALFFDPARRAENRRAFSIEHYTPPLRIIQSWLPRCPALGVKISPGVDLDELRDYACEVEFISLHGELKEAALWFGRLHSGAPRRATLLPGPHTLVAPARPPASSLASAPQAFLYEPDAAVLRAGLVTTLAEQLEARQLDADIAYLTAERQTPTPFGRGWAVEDWFPFQLKRLRAYLRQRGVQRVTVKKRGSPIAPEALIRDLRLNAAEGLERTLFLTHLHGQPIVIIALPQPL